MVEFFCIFSFKKFKDSIDRYKVWVIAYTRQLRTPMMFYTAAINGVFATLIAGGLLLTPDGVTSGFLLDLSFYISITPVKMCIGDRLCGFPLGFSCGMCVDIHCGTDSGVS